MSVFVVALVVLVGGFVWFMRQIDPPGPPGAAVTIELPDGLADEQIGAILADEGVIASTGAFSLYTRVRGIGAVPEGDYEFNENQSMGDVVAVLRAGPKIISHTFTIPEGYTISQIAERVGEDVPTISKSDFLRAVASGDVRSQFMPANAASMEGFLFPDTYTVGEKKTAEEILGAMVKRFDEVAIAAGVSEVPGYTPYEVITIASMVEREARVDGDRAKIAQVIYNRLAEGMRLQIDATLLYTKPVGSTPTRSDLKADGPYNTYTRAGLPPTPISNPGRAALVAASRPADGAWLYYVISGTDGSHAFSESYDEFLDNKATAQAEGLL